MVFFLGIILFTMMWECAGTQSHSQTHIQTGSLTKTPTHMYTNTHIHTHTHPLTGTGVDREPVSAGAALK